MIVDAATKDEVLIIIKCCFPLCLSLFRISNATLDDRMRRRAMTSAATILTRIHGTPMIGSTGKRIWRRELFLCLKRWKIVFTRRLHGIIGTNLKQS